MQNKPDVYHLGRAPVKNDLIQELKELKKRKKYGIVRERRTIMPNGSPLFSEQEIDEGYVN